jgi:ribosomal protein L24
MAITLFDNNGNAKVEYNNSVLSEYYDNNFRIMSDVWGTAHFAVVWDAENNRAEHVLVAICDQGCWGQKAIVEVDATPDVVEAYRNYKAERAYAATYERLHEEAEAEAMAIAKGDLVQVKRGRNAKGVSGKVVAVIQRQYQAGWKSSVQDKLAVATSDEMVEVLRNGKVYRNHKDVVWVWKHNVDKMNVPAIDLEAIRAAASEAADKARASA